MNKIGIANTLIELRKQRAFSQQELSNKSGVTLRTIQRIEAAEVSPHLQTLSLLASALGVEVERFASPPAGKNATTITNKQSPIRSKWITDQSLFQKSWIDGLMNIRRN